MWTDTGMVTEGFGREFLACWRAYWQNTGTICRRPAEGIRNRFRVLYCVCYESSNPIYRGAVHVARLRPRGERGVAVPCRKSGGGRSGFARRIPARRRRLRRTANHFLRRRARLSRPGDAAGTGLRADLGAGSRAGPCRRPLRRLHRRALRTRRSAAAPPRRTSTAASPGLAPHAGSSSGASTCEYKAGRPSRDACVRHATRGWRDIQ